ncbi:MAG: S-methyl-5-thioribose-1-phosphate isomerase, partial [Desulfuromonadales bacterium]|nr:S-methyl-5-thioribose-1-phosphate isomerase [Desulfuromonadales bacterium]
AAAYGLITGMGEEAHPFETVRQRAEYLMQTRPTAVNLSWALRRMLRCAERYRNEQGAALMAGLEAEARAIHEEDVAACKAIGEAGLPFVRQHPRLVTHCNAGALAVSGIGTALAPVYVAHRQGIGVHVYVDETRPLLQGARLTAYELGRAGVPMTLMTDSMAASAMSTGRVDGAIVGADRIAANGDVANKIGTLNLAVLCRYFRLPFYVACPTSTLDPDTPGGEDIEIEQRAAGEVTGTGGSRRAPAGVDVYNPAFDVTPSSLVTAIITDRGIIEPPY